MPFAGASIGSICYVLSWMIQVLTIQYYENFALGYLYETDQGSKRRVGYLTTYLWGDGERFAVFAREPE